MNVIISEHLEQDVMQRDRKSLPKVPEAVRLEDWGSDGESGAQLYQTGPRVRI